MRQAASQTSERIFRLLLIFMHSNWLSEAKRHTVLMMRLARKYRYNGHVSRVSGQSFYTTNFYGSRWLSVFDVYLCLCQERCLNQGTKMIYFLCWVLLSNDEFPGKLAEPNARTHRQTMMIHCRTLFIRILHFNHGHRPTLRPYCVFCVHFTWFQWKCVDLFRGAGDGPELFLFTGCNHFSLLNIKGNIVWDGHSVLVFDAKKEREKTETTICILARMMVASELQ